MANGVIAPELDRLDMFGGAADIFSGEKKGRGSDMHVEATEDNVEPAEEDGVPCPDDPADVLTNKMAEGNGGKEPRLNKASA